MLVEEVQHASAPKVLSRAQQKAGYSVLDNAARLRQTARHLEELQRDNDTEVRIEVPGPSTADRKRQTQGVRKILASRKTLQNHMDECDMTSYLNTGVSASKYPARRFCSVCGYWGKYKCSKCGTFNCSQGCQLTHKETGCHR